jgi:hypothetical protein
MGAITDTLTTLESMGFTLPSRAYLIGAILFSTLGYAGYRYGKKVSVRTTKWIGIALMLYPYVIWETWLMYTVGAGLCIGLYISSLSGLANGRRP